MYRRWIDVPRDDVIAAVADLPARTRLQTIRDYDADVARDYVGDQWIVTNSDVKMSKGKNPKPLANTGKFKLTRRTYNDLSLPEKVDQTINAVRNYDALIRADKFTDAELAASMLPQRDSQARRDLKAALINSADSETVFQRGPGQVGSHNKKFKGDIRIENATQFIDDIGIDRVLRTRTSLPQQGHIFAKSENPDIARDITLMRGQEGEVNWYDGDGNYVNMSRVENLQNGRRLAMERLGGLLSELEASGASEKTMSNLLGTMMELGGL